MILTEPTLAQNLVARAQQKPQPHWIGSADREIELRPPVARHIVGHGLGENIREGAARGPKNGLGFLAEGQGLERRALELDHEFAHALGPRLARLAAIAEARRYAARK